MQGFREEVIERFSTPFSTILHPFIYIPRGKIRLFLSTSPLIYRV